MFRREKTEVRQLLAALSGVIAIVAAVALGNWGSVIPLSTQKPEGSLASRSLLSAGSAVQGCTRLPDGSLILSLAPGSAAAQACCVRQEPLHTAKPHEEFSATIVAEKVVDEFLITAETAGKQLIPLYRGRLYAIENSLQTSLPPGMQEHPGIATVCFSATGPSDAQTIRITRAFLAPSGK